MAAIMGLSEIFAYVIVSAFAPDFDLNAKNGLALILFMIFSKTLFLLIVYILMIVSKKQKIQQSANDHSAPLLLLIPVASIFIILTFITIGETTLATANMNTLIYVSAFLLLLINLLVFGINQYSQKRSRKFTDMQLLLQKESDLSQYYELILSQHENQGILIHDFKKHLQSIALLNQAMDTEKIDAYIKQLLKSSDFTQSARICDNKMPNAILSRYARQCADKVRMSVARASISLKIRP